MFISERQGLTGCTGTARRGADAPLMVTSRDILYCISARTIKQAPSELIIIGHHLTDTRQVRRRHAGII